ncbi:hypothetical protein [Actinosynnema sp. NPDC020468]|uniref:hypothetical protein n=1 Tax=Actinosynnema sp. NPDC020468 TaxID=3154488 RepID=UPI0033D6277F
MSAHRIATPEALDAWLAECGHFVDGHLAAVGRVPSGRVAARFEHYLRHGPLPGDRLVVAVRELAAAAPTACTEPVPLYPAHFLEEVEGGATAGGLFVETWAPGTFRLEAPAFQVRELSTVERRTAPSVQDDRFTAVLATERDDGFWVDAVGALLGAPVVWRALGGGARPAGLDPDGCFLQLAADLDTTSGGVWHARHVGRARSFHRSSAGADLWWAVRTVVSGVRDLTEVRTGNCTFRPADWLGYLATGVLPPAGRLRPVAY